ncbi:D-aminoacylase, putative [Cordyceps militaris CM01]|uniref:D-aminoacylase, putative n=1 Tax=Cordyceps militaris (strain CM01) TaxID=983644 RepID=G3JGE8_CORMM|nr:D-aminoacylase, putative [Cordyceps militaris CM01]EGX93661.1 D-aminoacylase, putative [Cordyceps militaris CM01]
MYASVTVLSTVALALVAHRISDFLSANRTPESPPQKLDLVLDRLASLEKQIEELRSIGGNAGLSIGVAHAGTSIFEKHFGFRNVSSATPPDSQTVQHIGSMTKAFVAAAVASLVDEGKLSWETPLGQSGVVPLFSESNTEPENKSLPQVTLVDLLAHRLGVAMKQSYWHLMSTALLSQKANTAHIVSKLPPVAEFRSKMSYNNWGYALAGEIIEHVSGQDLGQFLAQRFFQPLGLENTTLGKPSSENYAASYMALSDGTPFQVEHPPLNSGTLMAPAGAMKSTMSDMLVLYSAFLKAFQDQSLSDATSKPTSPFRQATALFAKHSTIQPGSAYGMGWCLTELPDQAGLVGVNSYESPDGMPVIGKDTKPQRLFYHNGAMCGALSAIYLLPDSDFVVVVLGNSFDLYDTPDFTAQLLVESIIGAPNPVDFIPIAKKTVANALSHHPDMNAQLERERTHGTSPKPLSDYTGYYTSAEGNDYGFQITVLGDKLRVNVQGIVDVFYDLEHYEHDVFVFYCDRDAESKIMIYPNASIMLHKFFFKVDKQGRVMYVRWAHDFTYPSGELFKKGRA